MEINQLNQRIAVINAESKRLNNERQVNIGKRETLVNQLNKALEDYSSKYGVALTADTLESEINRVVAIKDQEIKAVENMLEMINSGNFEGANSLANGVATEAPAETVATATETVVTPVAETPVTPPPVAQATETPLAPAVDTPVAPPPVFESVETPVAPPPVSVSVETPVAPPPVAAPPVFDTPVAPPPVAPAEPQKEITSFNAILGGSAFNPQIGG